MFIRFNQTNFHSLCDKLGSQDADLQQIISTYGYPPFWCRTNTFESLLHIILEQQVSLASALATLNKLKEKISSVTPENFLKLTDEELRACYFSRQKTIYARELAKAVISNKINLPQLAALADDVIREKLISVKGIGNWTVDIYLIFILQHTDIFPMGDLAAVNAMKVVKKISKEDIISIAEKWRPYRSIAVMLLWHFYLEKRKAKNKLRQTADDVVLPKQQCI